MVSTNRRKFLNQRKLETRAIKENAIDKPNVHIFRRNVFPRNLGILDIPTFGNQITSVLPEEVGHGAMLHIFIEITIEENSILLKKNEEFFLACLTLIQANNPQGMSEAKNFGTKDLARFERDIRNFQSS